MSLVESEKLQKALELTLEDIAIMTTLAMNLRGENSDISEFIPLLSVKLLEVAKENGATPAQLVLAMVNYLTASVVMHL
jgi:hypothetical protein